MRIVLPPRGATQASRSPAGERAIIGWGSAPEDTIKVARLAVETGLFPLFEARHGEVTARTAIRHKVPVTDYLKLQKRYAHLFGNPPDAARIELIQMMADRNIADYGLQG
jgi:pyruvate ferredoxin oxidoreductase beta subunit